MDSPCSRLMSPYPHGEWSSMAKKGRLVWRAGELSVWLSIVGWHWVLTCSELVPSSVERRVPSTLLLNKLEAFKCLERLLVCPLWDLLPLTLEWALMWFPILPKQLGARSTWLCSETCLNRGLSHSLSTKYVSLHWNAFAGTSIHTYCTCRTAVLSKCYSRHYTLGTTSCCVHIHCGRSLQRSLNNKLCIWRCIKPCTHLLLKMPYYINLFTHCF